MEKHRTFVTLTLSGIVHNKVNFTVKPVYI